MRVRLLSTLKPNNYTESCMIDEADRWRGRNVWYLGRSVWYALSSRKRCQSIKPSLEKIKVYARGWLNYYGIASMKNNIDDINGWLYHRIRMCIWKQWKLPRTKKRNLIKMGIHEYYANMAANCRRGHWYCANLTTV